MMTSLCGTLNISKKVLTLILVRKEPNNILLGLKKRGFGAGKWNGFGGKVNPGESIVHGALRELEEESGLIAKSSDLTQFGLIDFEFVGDPVILEVHLFSTAKFEGDPIETEEMLPKWYKINEIPFDQMWADDKYWFPLFLSGKKFKAYFLFEGHETVLNHSIQLIDKF